MTKKTRQTAVKFWVDERFPFPLEQLSGNFQHAETLVLCETCKTLFSTSLNEITPFCLHANASVPVFKNYGMETFIFMERNYSQFYLFLAACAIICCNFCQL